MVIVQLLMILLRQAMPDRGGPEEFVVDPHALEIVKWRAG